MMETLIEILMVVLLSLGGLFCLLAVIGMLRFPDVYSRMQAASKAVTLGATSIVMAAALHFREAESVVRCLLVGVFFFVTIPVASHLIARAAYRSGEPLAPETTVNEMASTADENT